MSERQRFIAWYNEHFKSSAEFEAMAATVENSPYHREANTGVHTDMVVAEYVNQDVKDNFTLGALAAAWHDVGKPSSEEVLYSEERGTYRRYAGHEQVSSRLFVNAAMSGSCGLNTFALSKEEIFLVAWMIENHLPWQLASEKMRWLRTTAYHYGLIDTFVALVTADQRGRNGDPEKSDPRKLDQWIENFMLPDLYPMNLSPNHRTLFVMVGPSGSGKSTFMRERMSDTPVFSLDGLRHEFYDMNDYAEAFRQASADPQFKSRANARFIEMLRDAQKVEGHIAVDNTNTSRKARRFYLAEAGRRHFRTVAVVFMTHLQTIIDRQATRGDKSVPDHVVVSQFMAVQLPQLGEFDEILVI